MLTMTIHGADGMMVRERDDVTIDEAVAEMVASGHWREIGPGDEPTAIINCSVTHEYRALVAFGL